MHRDAIALSSPRPLLALCGCVLLAAAGAAGAPIPASERAGLIALYNSTNGAGWIDRTNWRNAEDTDFAPPGTECTWHGVNCGTVGELRVFGLDLSDNQLTGSIPPEIFDLTYLEYLGFAYNVLTGPIPPEIGHSPAVYIHLEHNQLSGAIPSEIGSLRYVQELHLEYNQLTGAIPAEIANLDMCVSLHDPGTLRLDHNLLSGPIPPEIGGLCMGGPLAPGTLSIDHNQLSGPIPSQIGDIAYLGSLSLDHNQLTGPIPSQIGKLTRLSTLGLSENQLTGPIPQQVGYLRELQRLAVSGNRLSGPIPPGIGSLTELLELGLAGNQLRGPIPSTFTNLAGLRNGASDFRWNALYTSDPALRDLLDLKQFGGDWEDTQTIAPTGLEALSPTLTTVSLLWEPIPYTGDTGGYRIWYATRAGGPYNLERTKRDKASFDSAVIGLSPGTTYYFAVDTMTEPHADNQNTVVSDRSAEVSATTTSGGVDWHALSVVSYGAGTVSSSTGGIACGGVCSATFAPGSPVTLAASPDAGSTFLGWGGACAGTAPTCDLTMDSTQTVSATFGTPATSYYTVTPCRVFDSRDAGLGGPVALAAATENAIVVAGNCAVPSTAKAVSLNVTVVSPSASGHLRLYASGTPRPGSSSINYASGQTRANNAVVALGADGALIVYVNQPSGTVHVVLDVNGCFK